MDTKEVVGVSQSAPKRISFTYADHRRFRFPLGQIDIVVVVEIDFLTLNVGNSPQSPNGFVKFLPAVLCKS